MTKQIKLTAKQQEVVNLMAKGCALYWGTGTGINSYFAGLRGAKLRVPANLPSQLERKGIVRVTESDWKSRSYGLTDLGKTLAGETEKPKTIVRWSLRRRSTDAPVAQEFVSETAQFLVGANGVREAKKNTYYEFFETEEAAMAEIYRRLKSNVKSLESSLQKAKNDLAKFEKQNPEFTSP